MSKIYKVRFNGLLNDSYNIKDIKVQLAKKFNLSADKIDKIFRKKTPFTLKKTTDKDKAGKYNLYFRSIGINSSIQELRKTPVSETPTVETSVTEAQVVTDYTSSY